MQVSGYKCERQMSIKVAEEKESSRKGDVRRCDSES